MIDSCGTVYWLKIQYLGDHVAYFTQTCIIVFSVRRKGIHINRDVEQEVKEFWEIVEGAIEAIYQWLN